MHKSIQEEPMDFSVSTAIDYARAGQLEDWIHAYLTSGSWANDGLADGLRLQKRWWLGPISVESTELIRACGPEPWMEYQVPPEHWEQKINTMAGDMTNLLSIPPLIVEYRSGNFSIRDGDHRHEAMRRKGWSKCWVIIWHNSEEDWMLNPYTITTER